MNAITLFKKGFIWLLAACLCALCLSACSLPQTVQCDVDDLIQRINDANATPATTDTLNLTQGCDYQLVQINNVMEGANGLPIITSPIVINGNDAVISRSSNTQEKFRLIYVAGSGDLTLNHLTLTKGYAYDPSVPSIGFGNSGGAILNRGHLSINKSIIMVNNATKAGKGGLVNLSGTVEIADSTFDRNETGPDSSMGGSAILNWGGDVTLVNSTISRNGISTRQDAIWTNGTLSLTNSTVSGNGWDGIDNEGDVYLNFVTFADNVSFGINGTSGSVSMWNTLFGSNGRGACSPMLPLTSFDPSNMDTDGSCGGQTVPASALNLAPLGDYGGLTETHALLPGSPAIDQIPAGASPPTHLTASCLPTDQRGEHRPYGAACDIGAFEYTGNGTPVPALSPTDTTAARACTFTATVDLNCRSGPGAMSYPAVDWLTAGESAEVVGQSTDGQYVYLTGPRTGEVCVVPVDPDYGALTGEACNALAVLTPPPAPTVIPTTASPQGESQPQTGCTVRQLSSGLVKCVVPCPEGADPGEACTP